MTIDKIYNISKNTKLIKFLSIIIHFLINIAIIENVKLKINLEEQEIICICQREIVIKLVLNINILF